jgi:hypothetical protein
MVPSQTLSSAWAIFPEASGIYRGTNDLGGGAQRWRMQNGNKTLHPTLNPTNPTRVMQCRMSLPYEPAVTAPVLCQRRRNPQALLRQVMGGHEAFSQLLRKEEGGGGKATLDLWKRKQAAVLQPSKMGL